MAEHGIISIIIGNPILSIAFAALSVFMLVQHVRKGKTHTPFSNFGLAGIALYFIIDAFAHIAPVIQAFPALGAHGPMLAFGLLALILIYLGFKLYQQREKAHHHHVGSGDITKGLATYGLMHSLFHVLIAGRALLGFAVAGQQEAAMPGFFGILVAIIENPWLQLGVAFLNGYILYVEFKHKHH